MPPLKGWKDENKYDALIRAASAKWAVPVPLIKGIIAHESSFNPLASLKEAPRDSLPPTPDHPKGGDESRGLMQVLARTARGLGYTGSLDGLYDPALSIELGTHLLSNILRQAKGDIPVTLSAYNGGFSKVRPNDGKRVSDTLPSPFINQAYVDLVLSYVDYFRKKEAAHEAGPGDFTDVTGGSSTTPTKPGGGIPPWVLLLLLFGGLAFVVSPGGRKLL